jgi:hypothetical protein
MNQINLYEEKKINISENKFIQRMIVRNKIENTICSWIMKEFENYEKDNKEWVNNYYFIDGIENENNIFILEKINNIFPYILETFGSIIDDIIKCYYLNNDKYIYKINEIFIEKYEYNLIKKEYINYKYCDIVINISLNINSNNEFKIEKANILRPLSRFIYNNDRNIVAHPNNQFLQYIDNNKYEVVIKLLFGINLKTKIS